MLCSCCRADGRGLQAVKAHDAPHQVANYNFGSWESWEVTSSGLVNVQWRHKVNAVALPASLSFSHVLATSGCLDLQALGLDIREVRVVAREDIRKTERHQMHASRDSRSKVSYHSLLHLNLKHASAWQALQAVSCIDDAPQWQQL